MISLAFLFFINIINIKIITAMVIFVINTMFLVLWVFVNNIRKSISNNENWVLETDEQLGQDLDTMDHLEEEESKTNNGCGSIKSL